MMIQDIGPCLMQFTCNDKQSIPYNAGQSEASDNPRLSANRAISSPDKPDTEDLEFVQDIGPLWEIGDPDPVEPPRAHSGHLAAKETTQVATYATQWPVYPLSKEDSKRQRLIRNRESARKCRAKKKHTVANLEERVRFLELENTKLCNEHNALRQCIQNLMCSHTPSQSKSGLGNPFTTHEWHLMLTQ